MMHFPHFSELDLLRERHLERWALEVCRSLTFLECLKAYGIAPTMQVRMPKGKLLTVSASHIYGARTKFFATLDLEEALCHLTLVGEKFVPLYQEWLLHEDTERYRYLTAPEQRAWLTQVVTLVVARYVMSHKYALFTQGRQTFADPWVGGEMGYVQVLHSLPNELARLVHHIVRDAEQQHVLIEQFFTELGVRMQGHQFGLPDPLPPLPEGTFLPFTLLSPAREDTDEQ